MAKGGSRWRGICVAAYLTVLALPAPAEAQEVAPPGALLQLSVEPVHLRVMDATRRAGAQVLEAYRRSPVLAMGLVLAGAVPLLAGLFAVGRAFQRRGARRAHEAPSAPEPARVGDKAWIDIGDGADALPVVFTGELLSIGRHSDNDITLDHESVHRHHALIQRTPDEEYVLMDLTAGTGNQPLVNGRAAARAVLSNGDRIALGEMTLTFHLGVGVPAASVRPDARLPATSSVRETTYDERDAGDGVAGRAADGVQTRRIDPADRVAARRAHRGRSG